MSVLDISLSPSKTNDFRNLWSQLVEERRLLKLRHCYTPIRLITSQQPFRAMRIAHGIKLCIQEENGRLAGFGSHNESHLTSV